MRFVTYHRGVPDEQVFRGVDAALTGHVYDEVVLTVKDIRDMALMKPEYLSAWVDHLCTKARL